MAGREFIVERTTAPAPTWSTYFAGLNANVRFFVDIQGNMGFPDTSLGNLIPDNYMQWVAALRSPIPIGSFSGQTIPNPLTDRVHIGAEDVEVATGAMSNNADTAFIIRDEAGGTFVLGARGQGEGFAEFSTSGNVSIIDTGLTLDDIGSAAMYWLFVVGNPSNSDNPGNRDAFAGIINIVTGDATPLTTEISLTTISNPDTPTATDISVAVTFWDGATENTTVTPLDSGEQIRIRVTYTDNPGTSQTVRLQPLISSQ